MKSSALNLMVVSLLAANLSWAGPVYKSVDKDGNVSYSSRPPAENSQQVALPPGPTEAQVQDAMQRQERTKQQAQEMSQDRSAREAARSQSVPSSAPVVEPSANTTYDNGIPNRRKIYQRIPTESPGGGQHPVYKPGNRPSPKPVPYGR